MAIPKELREQLRSQFHDLETATLNLERELAEDEEDGERLNKVMREEMVGALAAIMTHADTATEAIVICFSFFNRILQDTHESIDAAQKMFNTTQDEGDAARAAVISIVSMIGALTPGLRALLDDIEIEEEVDEG